LPHVRHGVEKRVRGAVRGLTGTPQ
jgi:hypothetical protein